MSFDQQEYTFSQFQVKATTSKLDFSIISLMQNTANDLNSLQNAMLNKLNALRLAGVESDSRLNNIQETVDGINEALAQIIDTDSTSDTPGEQLAKLRDILREVIVANNKMDVFVENITNTKITEALSSYISSSTFNGSINNIQEQINVLGARISAAETNIQTINSDIQDIDNKITSLQESRGFVIQEGAIINQGGKYLYSGVVNGTVRIQSVANNFFAVIESPNGVPFKLQAYNSDLSLQNVITEEVITSANTTFSSIFARVNFVTADSKAYLS